MLAVAVMLALSLLAAWATFLSLTAIVFIIAFRSIFPPKISNSTHKDKEEGKNVTLMRKELESVITRGFEKDDLQARAKTFEAVKRIFVRKIMRRYGMNEAEFKGLIEDPNKLQAILGDPELVQLLSVKLNLRSRLWNLGSLSSLIDKVEDWGR